MTSSPRFWIGLVAIVAAVGILVVLITPAPDELPSTSPHWLDHSVPMIATFVALPTLGFLSISMLRVTPFPAAMRVNLLAFTCTLLC